MTIYALPATSPFMSAKFEIGYDANAFSSQSPLNGTTQTIAIPGDRFIARMTIRAASHDDRADVEGFFAAIKPSQQYSINRISCHHIVRPAPRGTLRGLPVLTSSVSQLAMAIPITTSAGATLLRGDLIGIGGQTVMVTSSVTANGSGLMTSVPISAALRASASTGAAITWDKPTFNWAVVGIPMWTYQPGGVSDEVTIELVEDFAS